VSAPQKPKAVDSAFVAPALARDGRTTPLSGTQVLRAQHHFSALAATPTTGDRGATLMSDVVHSNDAVEPTWSDRAPADPDLAPTIVVPGATNGPH
jgi:hypothetical protein